MKNIISLHDISLSYIIRTGMFSSREISVLNNIDLDIEEGSMVSIIGFNGAGKTSLLSIIAGILPPDSGSVSVKGRTVPFLGLGIGFNPELTAEENIYLYGAIMGLSRRRIKSLYNSIVSFAEMEEFMDLKIKEFSSGMYVRLGFSVAIHTSPEILIIDEVLAVGDFAFQRKCLNKIMELKKNNVTILFVSHDMGLVSRFSDRVILLDRGIVKGGGESWNIAEEFIQMKSDMPGINANRRGSQEVRIESISIDGGSVFNKGDTVNLQIEYDNRADIDKAIMGFSLYNNRGFLIAGPNTYDNTGHLIGL